MNKSIIIELLLKSKFFRKESNKFKDEDKVAFINHIKNNFISDYEECVDNDYDNSSFRDSLGNIDIWKDQRIVRTLYFNDKSEYNCPWEFIESLINFGDKYLNITK